MAVSYASIKDLRLHWPDLPDHLIAEAEQKLKEASTEIRALYPQTDQRIKNGELSGDVAMLVTNRMVKRALNRADTDLPDGVTQFQSTVGPFAQSMSFSNADGNVYLSAADKRLLAPPRLARQAWTIEVN